MDEFTTQYIETALWSSVADDGDGITDSHRLGDVSPESLAKMVADCVKFQSENHLDLSVLEDEEQGGRDFWLTRCGHGAGFWDGYWPEPQASRLTEACEQFGNVDLYVGDDGKIYSL